MRILITLCALLISLSIYAENVAVITKARGEVLLRKSTSPHVDQAVTKGTFLEVYDQIRVRDGFSILMLTDGQSQFKLRENTVTSLTLAQERNGSTYRIRLDYGQALADFKTQDGTTFHIHTPMSVISVKGTSFWTLCDPEEGDHIIVLEGVVEAENNVSGETSVAAAGQSIRSTPSGEISVATTSVESIPEDPEISFGRQQPLQEKPVKSATVPPEKHTMRNVGIILGVVMVLLFALAL